MAESVTAWTQRKSVREYTVFYRSTTNFDGAGWWSFRLPTGYQAARILSVSFRCWNLATDGVVAAGIENFGVNVYLRNAESGARLEHVPGRSSGAPLRRTYVAGFDGYGADVVPDVPVVMNGTEYLACEWPEVDTNATPTAGIEWTVRLQPQDIRLS